MKNIVVKASLVDGTEVVWDKRWITNIESLSQSSSDPSSIQYGAIDSSGSVSIIDIDGSIYNNIVSGRLPSENLDIYISYNGNNFRKHIVTTSNYDLNSNILTLTLKGIFHKFAQENYSGIPLYTNRTAIELVSTFLGELGYTDAEIRESMSDTVIYADNNVGTIYEYLSSIIIPFPHIKNGTKKIDIFNDVCALAQLQVFENDNGNLKFVSARPVMLPNTDRIIKIKANNQYSQFDSAVITDNKYKSVGFTEKKYYLAFKNIEDISVGFFDQTTATGSAKVEGEEKILYSGLLEDYKKNISFSTNDTNQFKIYGIYHFADEIDTNNMGIICRYSFDIGDSIIDNSTYNMNNLYEYKNPVLGVRLKNWNYNTWDFGYAYFSQETKYGLQYTSGVDNFDLNEAFILMKPNFVDSEEEALKNLCNIENGVIASIKTRNFSGSHSFYQIVRNGNFYTCYFLVAGIVKDTPPIAVNFTGDMEYIYLNGSLSLNIYCLQDTSREVNDGADVSIPDSELLQLGTKLNGKEMYEILSQNILNDYSDGISEGTITVSLEDYYNIKGDKVVSSENGQMLKVGDIVRIDKNDFDESYRTYKDGEPMYWRITGRKFRKKGVPFLDLEVVEVKDILRFTLDISQDNSDVTVIRTSSPLANAPLSTLGSGDIVYKGDTLVVTAYVELGYSLNLNINGDKVSSGVEHTVTGDVFIVSTAEAVASYTLTTNKTGVVTRIASPIAGASTGSLSSGAKIYDGDQLEISTTNDIRTYAIKNAGTVIYSGDAITGGTTVNITVAGDVSVSITYMDWHWVVYGSTSEYSSLSFSAPTVGTFESWKNEGTMYTGGVLHGLLPTNENKKYWNVRIHYYNPYLNQTVTTNWYNIEGTDGSNLDRVFVGSGCAFSIGPQTPAYVYINDYFGTNYIQLDVTSNYELSYINGGSFDTSTSTETNSRNYISKIDFFVEQYEYS